VRAINIGSHLKYVKHDRAMMDGDQKELASQGNIRSCGNVRS